METLSPTIRLIVVFIAAAIAGLAAADPVGIPSWAQVLIAALSAGFVGIGVLPPTYQHDPKEVNPPDNSQ